LHDLGDGSDLGEGADGDHGSEPVVIGSPLELFVDDYLIDRAKGDIRFQLHRPERREVVLRTDAP